MQLTRRYLHSLFIAATAVIGFAVTSPAISTTPEVLERDSRQALETLYLTSPAAEFLSRSARGILVFPNIVKAGLVFGGSYGEGVLIKSGSAVRYYNSFTASWGLQAGAQTYGYAVFLMTDEAVNYLEETRGWEFGVGPTIVLVDEGIAANLSTSSLQDNSYAFIFGQQGLMAGISFEGTKISQIDP